MIAASFDSEDFQEADADRRLHYYGPLQPAQRSAHTKSVVLGNEAVISLNLQLYVVQTASLECADEAGTAKVQKWQPDAASNF